MKQRHLSWIELSRDALNSNIAALERLARGRTLAVAVKANAYGHGLAEIASLLQENPAVGALSVHSVDEAIGVRAAGWDRTVMVLGPTDISQIEAVFEHDLQPTVFEKTFLSTLGKAADKRRQSAFTHLKLETGTNRQGITAAEMPDFARIYHEHKYLERPYGAGMHFANIEDTTNHEYARYQLKQFQALLKEMARLGIKPKICHTASSAAMILFEKTLFDLVRPGIAVYGHWPSKETYLSYRLEGNDNDLFHPVLTWKTRITQLKKVPPDSFVGYGCTYRTTSTTRLAILPVGYYDGYARSLSNTAYVLIRGRRAPVRGRVCMNLMMVDVTDIKGVKVGDEVTLIGRDGSEVLTAEQLGAWADSINYEILARLSPLIPRIIR